MNFFVVEGNLGETLLKKVNLFFYFYFLKRNMYGVWCILQRVVVGYPSNL